MKSHVASCILALIVASVTMVSTQAAAQSWSEAQTEVWTVVTDSWDAIVAKDVSWSDNYVHANAVVWGRENPMPRKRASVKKWDRYNFENATTKVAEFSPAAIVVEGGTAVAHYYYSLGTENHEGKRRTVHGRCTDILVRSDASWKFLAWNCGDEPSDDD